MEAVDRARCRDHFLIRLAPASRGMTPCRAPQDYGLPDRGYRFMGQDSEGPSRCGRTPDGRNVRPFSSVSPSEPFANPASRSGKMKINSPLNPTAPGPLVPDSPERAGAVANRMPGLMHRQSPWSSEPAAVSRAMLDFILDELRVDARIGINLTATTPDGRAAGDPLHRRAWSGKPACAGRRGCQACSRRWTRVTSAEIARIASRVIGVGMRVGEGVNEPQLFRAFRFQRFCDQFGNAMAHANPREPGGARPLYRGAAGADAFPAPNPDSRVDASEPGFVRVRGRLSLNVEPLALQPGEAPPARSLRECQPEQSASGWGVTHRQDHASRPTCQVSKSSVSALRKN